MDAPQGCLSHIVSQGVLGYVINYKYLTRLTDLHAFQSFMHDIPGLFCGSNTRHGFEI
jgi:hypothetical protein